MSRAYAGLYPQLTGFANLHLAFRKAARGKRGHSAVAAFEYQLEDNLLQLQGELQSQSYRPGPYTSFYISDPKRRLISAAPFRDRVVHHALCNVIEPLFERTFIGDSYANRLGKGTHRALDRAQAFSRRYTYALQCDVRQFFPSLDHAILLNLLARKLADPQVLWLCALILENGLQLVPGDSRPEQGHPCGLPIGNLTSQFWANVYLNELDQFVKRELRCRAYLRYVDDCLLFSDSKPELWKWKGAVRQRLATLRLHLHEASSTVYPVANGIPFLGFRLYPGYRRLKRRNGLSFARRLRGWRRQLARGELSYAELQERLQGWVAHARHGDTWGLRRSLLGEPLPSPHRASRPSPRGF